VNRVRTLLSAVVLAATMCCAPAAKVVLSPSTAVTFVGLVNAESIEEQAAYCSGVWVSQSSIVTAYHCMDEAEVGTGVWYVVDSDVYADGTPKMHAHIEKRSALLYDVDKVHDLALLRAGRAPASHGIATVAKSTPKQGEFVQVMGQSDGFLWWSYSSGDVAAIRTLEGADPDLDPKTIFIQTTAPISPGNSGGGIFNVRSELLGVCHAHFPHGQNLNLFIGTTHLQAFLDAQGTAL
jgi:S1-C subfamily serine protease